MPTDNSNAFSPQDLTRTEDQNRAFPNARGQVVPAIESAPEEPQDWKTPMAEPAGGWQQGGDALTFEPRPKEVNKILNSKHVLSDVDTSDPSNARVFVANFLNSKYDEDKRGIYKDYEGKTKAYGLSGDPVADAKSILDGDTKTHESSQTRIAKDRKVIAEGLDKLGYEERQGFGANAKNTFDRGFLDLGVGTAAQGALKGIESMGDEMERIERGLFEDLGITYYDEELGGPVTSEDVQKWREDVRERNTVDPEFLNSYTGGVIQGYGQAAAIVPAFLLNPAVGTGMSVAQAYQYGEDGYRDFVKSEGITYEESEARKAGLWNMPSAAVDVIANRFAIGKILKPLKGAKITKGGALEFLKDTAESAAMGSGTEGVQTVWENLNAKYLSGYDRDKVLTDGVVDAMVIGAFVDSTITAGGQGVTKGVNKLLGKTMDPVEGMTAVDWALALNVVPEAEFAEHVEREYGDEVTEDGVPLAELAWAARGGDRKAAQTLVDTLTLEVSVGAKEAGLTPAEAEARGKEAAEVADPVEPLVETPIDKEISTKKEELVALEEAEDSTPEDMKSYEKLDKEIQALETKRVEEIVKGKIMTPFTRGIEAEQKRVEQARLDKADKELEEQDQVIDLINILSPLSVNTTVENMPELAAGGPAIIQGWKDAGFSKKEIAAKSKELMTAQGMPNTRLEDVVQKGSQKSTKTGGGPIQSLIKLFKGANPFTVVEEFAHAEYDRDIANGTITVEQVRAWRKAIEELTDTPDLRGETDEDIKEWVAEQVKARIYGQRNNLSLPESFLKFLDDIISGFKQILGRAKELQDLEASGQLPTDFLEMLDRQGLVGKPAGSKVGVEGQPTAGTLPENEGYSLEVDESMKDVTKRTPEVVEAAAQYGAGKITLDEYNEIVAKADPIEPFTEVPAAATEEEIIGALKSDKVPFVGTENFTRTLSSGDRVGARLDIPAYTSHGVWVASVHEPRSGVSSGGAGAKIGYVPTVRLSNVNFATNPFVAFKIATGQVAKNTIATVEGDWVEQSDGMSEAEAKDVLNDPSWVQVGMNPFRHSYFYDRSRNTGAPVVSAEEVIQIGGLVLAKNPVYAPKNDPRFKIMQGRVKPSALEKAGVSDLDATFSLEQDAAYLSAVESDNMEAAQEMVDEQARMRGYNPLMRLFHGTKKRFDKLKSTRDPNGLIYFSTNEEMAQTYPRGSGGHRTPEADVQARIDNARLKSREYTNPAFEKLEAEYGNDIPMDLADEVFAKEKEIQRSLLDGMTVSEADMGMGIRVIGGYIKAKDIFEPSNWREFKDVIMESIGVESEAEILPQMMDAIESGNYIIWEKKAVVDAVLSKYDAMTIQETSGKPAETIAFRDPSQIKSSDPVTYDADGNVIPLSERFDPTRDEVNYSLEPLSEQNADAEATVAAEERQSRTPERQAFIDYQRELRKTDGDNTAEQKEKLQKLLQLATDADEIAELKQAGDEKIIRVVEQKVKQIRKQAAEREDVTESVKALERLINSPEVPMEVRARMRGIGRLVERKTPQGKARWIEYMANKLEAEIDRHYRTRNVRALRSFLRPFATQYAPNRRKLRKLKGEEARIELDFAQRLLNNGEATPPVGMTDARRDELVDIFGDVGNRQSSPTRVAAALDIAKGIAGEGRKVREEFEQDRRERNAAVGGQVVAQVLNTEDALDDTSITANERDQWGITKALKSVASLMIRGMEGFQQQLNKLDRIKGGVLETMFLSAAHNAHQTELAMNIEHAEQTRDDFATVLGPDNRVAAKWYKGSHEVHQTDIEWINNKKVGMVKRKLSKQQGVSLLMQWLDPSLRSTFLNMGIDGATIEQVKEFIGEIGVSEAYYFREKYAEMGIKLNAKHMEIEGIPLDMIDGYGGRARRQGAKTKEEDMQMFARNSAGRPTVKSGSMKERTNSNDYLMFMDADLDFTAHAKEVNHYISHAELARNLTAAFLTNEDARNAIKQKHGSKFYKSLADQVETIIAGRPTLTDTQKFWTKGRALLTKGTLMVKPAIMFKQLTSAPAFIEEIGPVAYTKAGTAMMKPENLAKFLPMIWGSEYVKNRRSTSQYADIQQSLDARQNVMKGMRLSDWVMMNVKVGDIGAVIMGGAPVYYHAYTEAKAEGMTDDQAQAKAEEVFGLASERAQQSSAGHAQGSFLKGQGLARSWFMYQTSPLQYQRNVNTSIANWVAQAYEWKNDRPSEAKKAAIQAVRAISIYHFILPQIFQAVASGLVGFTDDEDYIKEKFWARQRRAAYLGNLNTLPALGTVLSGLANIISGADETFRSSGSPIIDIFTKTAGQFNTAIKNGDDMDAWINLGAELTQARGIPAKTVRSYYEAITDVSEGNTENPLLRLLGWSKWSLFED